MARELPQGAELTELSAHFNHLTLPRALRSRSALPEEHWARLVVLEGKMHLFLGDAAPPEVVTPQQPAIIPRETEFRIEQAGVPARFFLEYYHEPRLRDAKVLASLLGRGRAA
ncbi:MAG: DUF1971 domain-containing protein [Candidatus Lambdaproteobacteria bacterium]|nr:DUF1971 domain-containing protein [Candidatus Lambdaproteobacteria bacterium]